jgi:hypothetical protein
MFYDPRHANGFYPIEPKKRDVFQTASRPQPGGWHTALGYLIALAPLAVSLAVLAVMSLWRMH